MSDTGLTTMLATLEGVEGWLSIEQAATLFQLAERCPPGSQIVEIGSYRGRSTIALASGAPSDVMVVAIDPHAGDDRGPNEIHGYAAEAAIDHERFLANLALAGVDQRVRHVRRRSDQAHDDVDGSIALLFIDGAHRHRPARRDIIDWSARVDANGAVVIHDAFSSVGVTTAILRTLLAGRRLRYLRRVRSLAIYRADLQPGIGPRLRNAGRQARQLPWFVANLALKVLLRLRLGALWRLVGRTAPEWPS